MTDPLTLAVALGLLGPAALDERDGTEDERDGEELPDPTTELRALADAEGLSVVSELLQDWELPHVVPGESAPSVDDGRV